MKTIKECYKTKEKGTYLEALEDLLEFIDEIDLECRISLDEVRAKRILRAGIEG